MFLCALFFPIHCVFGLLSSHAFVLMRAEHVAGLELGAVPRAATPTAAACPSVDYRLVSVACAEAHLR